MSRPKILFLTGVSTVANEKGEKKIEQAKNGKTSSSSGFPKSWYIEQNLRPPEDAEDVPEIDEEGMIHLQEDEIEHLHEDILIERSDFSSARDSTTVNMTEVLTKSGDIYLVLEDTSTIYEMLYIIDQNILEKWWDEIKWRVKRLISKEKDLVLELKQEELIDNKQ